VIESVSHYPSVHMRHRAAPLLRERDVYLAHLLEKGLEPARVRCVAAFLVHIVHLLDLDRLREVEQHEVEEASHRWIEYRSPQRTKTGVGAGATPKNFVRIAKAWLNFHGCLMLPSTSAPDFDLLIDDFRDALTSKRGLSPATVHSYTKRTQDFLKWASSWHSELALISMNDVDRFLISKRAKGWQLATIATQCQALRAFFGYSLSILGFCRTSHAPFSEATTSLSPQRGFTSHCAPVEDHFAGLAGDHRIESLLELVVRKTMCDDRCDVHA